MAAPVVAEQGRKNPVNANVCYSGFPARSLIKKSNNEGGEWITTYQVEQKRQLKAVMVSSRPIEHNASKAIFPPANTRETSGLTNLLNKQFLLKNCCAAMPEHLSVANISGHSLMHHNSMFFHEFDRLIDINASDNRLSLEAFEDFQKLRILDISVNGIKDVFCTTSTFSQLQSLNLSYNYLSASSLVSLGCLPVLKTLYLTGNSLVSLPQEMTAPFLKEGSDKMMMHFPELRTLWLDDNKLCDSSVFAVLAGLRQLEELVLSDNELRGIPQLRLLGTGQSRPPTKQEQQQQQSESDGTSLVNHSSTPFAAVPNTKKPRPSPRGVKLAKHVKFPSGTNLSQSPYPVNGFSELMTTYPVDRHYNTPRYAISSRAQTVLAIPSVDAQDSSGRHYKQTSLMKHTRSFSNPELYTELSFVGVPGPGLSLAKPEDRLNVASMASPTELGTSSRTDDRIWSSSVTTGGREVSVVSSVASMSPFPRLRVLNLSNNLVRDAEELLGCHDWPSLEQVVLSHNPVVGANKGLHPVLLEELVQGRGIQVVRQESKPEKSGTHIRQNVKRLRKVSSSPPPAVPKYPLLPAIEAMPSEATPLRLSRMEKPPSLGYPESDPNGSGYGYYGYGRQHSLGSESGGGSSMDSLNVFMTQVTSNEEAGGPKVEPATPPTGKIGKKEQVPKQGKREGRGVWSPDLAYQARLREVEERYKDVDDRYKGYEILLDDGGVTEDTGITIPTDVLGCCKNLQHLLRRPAVLPSHSSHSPALHRSYPPAFSGCKMQQKGGYATFSRVPRQGEILDEIKSQSVNTETDVASVLASSSSSRVARQLRRECRKLLAEMQKHYDGVKANALD